MKKLLLVSFLACFTILLSNAAVAYENDAATGEGSSAELQVGWMHSSLDFDDAIKDNFGLDFGSLTFNMWRIAGNYKYQVADELYGRASIFYAGSGKEKGKVNVPGASEHELNYKLKIWDFHAALGWTFAFAEAGLISPFLLLAYHNMRLKGTLNEGEESSLLKVDCKTKFYGFLIKLGLDLHYMFANNFCAGIIAMIGLPISNKLKYDGSVTKGEGDPNPDAQKYKSKNNFVFEVLVPVKYHIEDWTIGLEGSYSYRCFETKENLENVAKKGEVTRHNFGIALTGGLTF